MADNPQPQKVRLPQNVHLFIVLMRAAKSALDEPTATCHAPALLYPTLRAAEHAMLLNSEQPDAVLFWAYLPPLAQPRCTSRSPLDPFSSSTRREPPGTAFAPCHSITFASARVENLFTTKSTKLSHSKNAKITISSISDFQVLGQKSRPNSPLHQLRKQNTRLPTPLIIAA